ncbi:hypothetical protein, partial [Neisseria bacilliformis]|uniref:hypothetical protein n=1 Tax=Neisseria bacilliformis TaxID=267212 RepID=UPI0028E73B4D
TAVIPAQAGISVAPPPKAEKTPPPHPKQDSRLRGNDETKKGRLKTRRVCGSATHAVSQTKNQHKTKMDT